MHPAHPLFGPPKVKNDPYDEDGKKKIGNAKHQADERIAAVEEDKARGAENANGANTKEAYEVHHLPWVA